MKIIAVCAAILSAVCILLNASDTQVRHMKIDEIKKIISEGNWKTLDIVLQQKLSSWEKDALLYQSFTQHRYEHLPQLLKAGARAEIWMIDHLKQKQAHDAANNKVQDLESVISCLLLQLRQRKGTIL